MKLIAIVTLKIKSGNLPAFVATLYKHNCKINLINLTESEKKWEEYTIEIIYSSRKILVTFIDSIKGNSDLFKDITITSTLEDKIKGGLLRTSGKYQIETINDIETNLIGGSNLIHEKIDTGLEKNYTGVYNSVALISGFKKTAEKGDIPFFHSYTDSERDSVILSRFTGRNACPVVIKYQTIEDMLKTLKTIENNFACIRFMSYDDDDVLFDSIISGISCPVISRDFDEYPLYMLSLIKRMTKNHRLKPDQTSVGIIGLPKSATKLTRLLNRSGFMKVLGFDNRERLMMAFENERGLATTPENILMNTDILILMNDTFKAEMISMARPGQYVFSFIGDDLINAASFRERGVKEFVKLDEFALSMLFPGLLQGMLAGKIKQFDEEMLMRISDSIAKMLDSSFELPDIFSDIHEKIQSLV